MIHYNSSRVFLQGAHKRRIDFFTGFITTDFSATSADKLLHWFGINSEFSSSTTQPDAGVKGSTSTHNKNNAGVMVFFFRFFFVCFFCFRCFLFYLVIFILMCLIVNFHFLSLSVSHPFSVYTCVLFLFITSPSVFKLVFCEFTELSCLTWMINK